MSAILGEADQDQQQILRHEWMKNLSQDEQ